MKFKELVAICLLSLPVFFVQAASPSFQVTVTGNGAPVLLIPGYGCSGEVWNETVKQLSANYECHVLTLPGFAGVPPISPPFLSTIKKDILDYIEAKRLKQPILIGHSLGGALGLALAAEHPKLFRKLIVVDALPFYAALMNPAANADSLPIDAGSSGKMFAAMSDSSFRLTVRGAVQSMVSAPSDVERVVGWCAQSDKYTYGHEFVEFLKTDLRKKIGDITCPSLLLLAKGFGKEATMKVWNNQYAALRNKQIEYNDHALHFIMLDDPAWFVDRVEAFLTN